MSDKLEKLKVILAEVSDLDNAIEIILPFRSQFRTTQVMDEAYDGVGAWLSIRKKQGRMIKLVLDDKVKVRREAEVKIIQ